MTTTCQDVVAGAIARSVGNSATDLTSNTRDMITQVAAFEREVFTRVAKESRFFFGTYTATPTTLASGNRAVDTAGAGNIERITRAYLGTSWAPGSVLHLVDLEDVSAENAPRYFMSGTQMIEIVIPGITADWSVPALTWTQVTVEYALAPNTLDPAGSATQPITLPDRYADLLSIRLAQYLAEKDLESRDDGEIKNLTSDYETRLQTVILSLSMYPGITHRRFLNPEKFPVSSS